MPSCLREVHRDKAAQALKGVIYKRTEAHSRMFYFVLTTKQFLEHTRTALILNRRPCHCMQKWPSRFFAKDLRPYFIRSTDSPALSCHKLDMLTALTPPILATEDVTQLDLHLVTLCHFRDRTVRCKAIRTLALSAGRAPGFCARAHTKSLCVLLRDSHTPQDILPQCMQALEHISRAYPGW